VLNLSKHQEIENPITQLIECIPNFSEARRPEVIDQVVAAIQSVSDAVEITVS